MKIHTFTDGLANPLAFMLSSGADHDSTASNIRPG